MSAAIQRPTILSPSVAMTSGGRIGPVIPCEIGQILGCGRSPFDVPDLRYDAGPAQHVLGLLAELTIFSGKHLKIQLVLRL